MKSRLGAWQKGDDPFRGKVEFRIFFPAGVDPAIARIQVAGDFQYALSGGSNWDFAHGFDLIRQNDPEGTIWAFCSDKPLQAGFYQYKYRITFQNGSTNIVSDPCARYSGSDSQNAAFVIGGTRPQDNRIAPLAGGRRPLRDLILYELHLDDFTRLYRTTEAPLAAVIAKLDYIRAAGFNAILFMPWTAWKNKEFDWGYEPFQYFAVEYLFANDLQSPSEKLSWLKKLVSACHERGIHVIMDGVFNHVSTDFPYKWMYQNPDDCPYTGDYGGHFPGLQDLNFHNACTNEFIRDVCLYWIENFKIDGIRFDNTVNYYEAGDPHGITLLLANINAYNQSVHELNFSLTLEHIAPDACEVVNQTAATSYWDNALFECTTRSLWSHQIDSGFLNALNNQRFLDNEGKVPTLYTSNHDHTQVAFQSGASDNLGSQRWYCTQPYVIALFTAPATPLIQAGAEFGEDYWLPENDSGTGRRVIPRPIRWKMAEDPVGIQLRKLYQRLAWIRMQYDGLRSANFYPASWETWQTQFNPGGYGINTDLQVAIYHRWGTTNQGTLQRFIIVLNFSDFPRDVQVPFPENGTWTDLLSDFSGSWKPVVNNYRLDMTVNPHWGHIFFM